MRGKKKKTMLCRAVQVIKLTSSFLNSPVIDCKWIFTGKDSMYLSELSGKHQTKVSAEGGVVIVHF